MTPKDNGRASHDDKIRLPEDSRLAVLTMKQQLFSILAASHRLLYDINVFSALKLAISGTVHESHDILVMFIFKRSYSTNSTWSARLEIKLNHC